MGTVIAPCITVENLDQYKEIATRIAPFAQRVHIDLADGEFAPSFTVGANDLWWPEQWRADVHAMVARPSEYIQTLVAKKPNLIIFHAEVQEDLTQIIRYIQQAGIKAGISLQRPTVPLSVKSLIEIADHVQIFSGDLGHYGGTANLMQLEKVRLIRNIRPNVEIGWDGGVTVENAFTLAQGGVEVLNVGSAIANAPDASEVYARLVNEINKQGVI